MKKNYTLLFITFLLLFSIKLVGQTEWTGPAITITKVDFTDWTLQANQDRITPNVWLTRANSRGLFNIVSETIFDNNNFTSPTDTEWADGTIADGVGTLFFDTWDETNDNNAPITGQNKVLHLITEDIYIDITFTAWTEGDGQGTPPGGGFTYQRSTNQNLSTNDFGFSKNIKLFPNPSHNFIQVLGLSNTENYRIYTILGTEVLNGITTDSKKIKIESLTKGIYFIKINDLSTLKFIKN